MKSAKSIIIYFLIALGIVGVLKTQDVQFLVAQIKDSTQSVESPIITIKDKSIKNEQEIFLVTRVIDGDTIELENGQKVRYIGMDTPETKHPKKSVQCFGLEAYKKNKELVEGKSVRLIKDVRDKDVYDRLLRYVYVDDLFVNLELVKLGYAYAASFPPDITHQQDFNTAQNQARTQKLGLWESCPMTKAIK